MKRYLVVIYIIVLTQVAGCANLEAYSAGQIGCPPEMIKISDKSSDWYSTTWVATCKGKRFICSGQSTKYSSQVNCTPEQK